MKGVSKILLWMATLGMCITLGRKVGVGSLLNGAAVLFGVCSMAIHFQLKRSKLPSLLALPHYVITSIIKSMG